jgi:hypothetical protein
LSISTRLEQPFSSRTFGIEKAVKHFSFEPQIRGAEQYFHKEFYLKTRYHVCNAISGQASRPRAERMTCTRFDRRHLPHIADYEQISVPTQLPIVFMQNFLHVLGSELPAEYDSHDVVVVDADVMCPDSPLKAHCFASGFACADAGYRQTEDGVDHFRAHPYAVEK